MSGFTVIDRNVLQEKCKEENAAQQAKVSEEAIPSESVCLSALWVNIGVLEPFHNCITS